MSTGVDEPAKHHRAPGRARDERGSTLVEILIATWVMGIAVLALITGTGTLAITVGTNRQSTNSSVVVRDYAEALGSAITSDSWCSTAYSVSYTPPSGYSVSASFGACPALTAGTAQSQTVTITATAPNGKTETLKTVVRQP